MSGLRNAHQNGALRFKAMSPHPPSLAIRMPSQGQVFQPQEGEEHSYCGTDTLKNLSPVPLAMIPVVAMDELKYNIASTTSNIQSASPERR